MKKKRKPDKLALDMIRCKKDGFGCNYGRWKATQPPEPIEEDTSGMKPCKRCGKMFKPRTTQVYCDINCQYLAKLERQRKHKEEK
jgi:hypothetical protein